MSNPRFARRMRRPPDRAARAGAAIDAAGCDRDDDAPAAARNRRLRCVGAIVAACTLASAAAALPPNHYNEQLLRLDPLRQRSVIRRAILDDGGRCGRVIAAAFRGRFANLLRWDADCDAGARYAMFVGPDGSVQVRDCHELETLKLPACRPVASAR